MLNTPSIYGYFTDPTSTVPTYEPGLLVNCPICQKQLSMPITSISLMLRGDNKSYFYRTHKACIDALTEREQIKLDSRLMDNIGRKVDLN